MSERQCTCHPDDHHPVTCAEKYALSECRAAASSERQLGTQFPGNERFHAMDVWVEHDGGEMPVDGETVVIVRFRDGRQEEIREQMRAVWWSPIAGSRDHWKSTGAGSDIVAYRIVEA